ncbi:MAG: hypothetical protein O7H41_08970 [Planctomycetota bacterium]|nr:hypothetical protein [Planctomycetota bacterium]
MPRERSRWRGVSPSLLLIAGLIAGCAGGPSRFADVGDDQRGYRGVLLQAEGLDAPAPVEGPPMTLSVGVGTAVRNAVWIPWRLAFGLMGFVLAGDCGPIPFTGFRWLSGQTSPWVLGPGEYALMEDAYGPGEIPPRPQPWIGKRGSDPELLPSRSDP